MVGGLDTAVRRIDPIFKRLAPGRGSVARTPGRGNVGGTTEDGYLHCGRAAENGPQRIEYGLMAAYAEGLNILKHANVGTRDRLRRSSIRHVE